MPPAAIPRPRTPDAPAAPHPEYLSAFDGPSDPPATPPGETPQAAPDSGPGGGDAPGAPDPEAVPGGGPGGRLRLFTGLCAAAVTAGLTLLVVGQDATVGGGAEELAGADEQPGGGAPAGDELPENPPEEREPTYEEWLAATQDVDPELDGPGTFTVVPGQQGGGGEGATSLTYRVEVEDEVGVDAAKFARAVHTTLSDARSWSRDSAYSFERVDSGPVDFVLTLASPATTAEWCAKSGLDTTVDNVSCDSAATERIMINAYRWGHGSPTFGPDLIRPYREMLINHEVGHRIGLGHEFCPEDGALAPVMMQQTKTLTTGDRTCRPNAWPHPGA
ncbi:MULTISPECIES: DUF3152 domain-containing protein [unclassified Streptomyces]|uniref:DUF3152 domain-containing protein n=1 Tax=unclassified Streptomyces TaxID=2593676 RepID=UPI0022B67B78|nr:MULTISPECIES: DUF3152 domain-containing protein [unclassified Streptomyces]MCZ7416677.1 DUF3152 domain-containing protein [Streptomyces sp. WMMC897]MCZ7433513.1 DUF3152 domain-containing protein [Streptomyces sp. WMMC1477]